MPQFLMRGSDLENIYECLKGMGDTSAALLLLSQPEEIDQCFQLTPAQVSAPYATKNPVSCSSTHNAEIFEVVDWPLETNPVDMVHTDALKIASESCGFWDTFPDAQKNRLSKSEFNYWAWYTPDKAAWARGERWIRCDAKVGKFKSSTSWPPYA